MFFIEIEGKHINLDRVLYIEEKKVERWEHPNNTLPPRKYAYLPYDIRDKYEFEEPETIKADTGWYVIEVDYMLVVLGSNENYEQLEFEGPAAYMLGEILASVYHGQFGGAVVETPDTLFFDGGKK